MRDGPEPGRRLQPRLPGAPLLRLRARLRDCSRVGHLVRPRRRLGGALVRSRLEPGVDGGHLPDLAVHRLVLWAAGDGPLAAEHGHVARDPAVECGAHLEGQRRRRVEEDERAARAASGARAAARPLRPAALDARRLLRRPPLHALAARHAPLRRSRGPGAAARACQRVQAARRRVPLAAAGARAGAQDARPPGRRGAPARLVHLADRHRVGAAHRHQGVPHAAGVPRLLARLRPHHARAVRPILRLHRRGGGEVWRRPRPRAPLRHPVRVRRPARFGRPRQPDDRPRGPLRPKDTLRRQLRPHTRLGDRRGHAEALAACRAAGARRVGDRLQATLIREDSHPPRHGLRVCSWLCWPLCIRHIT
mmetsp:Transcript_768/g.2504  ORF Transcript_768/g.2504 Transcript_768/m.2504 type:complete len:364 (+) Transcript_768:386-1477(+)